MGRRVKLAVIFMLVLGVVGFGIGLAVGYFMNSNDISAALKSPAVIVCAIVGALVGLGMGLFSRRKINAGKKRM